MKPVNSAEGKTLTTRKWKKKGRYSAENPPFATVNTHLIQNLTETRFAQRSNTEQVNSALKNNYGGINIRVKELERIGPIYCLGLLLSLPYNYIDSYYDKEQRLKMGLDYRFDSRMLGYSYISQSYFKFIITPAIVSDSEAISL